MVNSVTIGAIEYEELVRDSEKVRVLDSLIAGWCEEKYVSVEVIAAVLGSALQKEG